MNLVQIESTPDGWLKVQFSAATETCFEIKVNPQRDTLIDVLKILPCMVNLDCDLMDFYDNPFNSEISATNRTKVKNFIATNIFQNIDSPIFDDILSSA